MHTQHTARSALVIALAVLALSAFAAPRRSQAQEAPRSIGSTIAGIVVTLDDRGETWSMAGQTVRLMQVDEYAGTVRETDRTTVGADNTFRFAEVFPGVFYYLELLSGDPGREYPTDGCDLTLLRVGPHRIVPAQVQCTRSTR